MAPEPPEPPCPADRKPHRDRIQEIVQICPLNKTAGVCIDNTPEHRAYYLHQLGKYKEISVVFQGALTPYTYLIKITKHAIN